jgi:hypothetical protein
MQGLKRVNEQIKSDPADKDNYYWSIININLFA